MLEKLVKYVQINSERQQNNVILHHSSIAISSLKQGNIIRTGMTSEKILL